MARELGLIRVFLDIIITKQILIPDAQLFNKRGIPQSIVKIRAIEL